jgi:hypothetical protein
MGNRMIDGYVRRDPNADSDKLASRDDGVILPEGVFMPSSAFRNTVPQTQYTMQELGIDLASSPFAPEVTPIPESRSNEVVVIRPTEVDWASENRETSAYHTLPSSGSNPLMTINDMVKQYWGLLIVGGLLLTAGVFIGRRA